MLPSTVEGMPLLLQIDAFTDVPFSGNPAAVCVLDGSRPDDWTQAVAAEMNLAETAFVTPRGTSSLRCGGSRRPRKSRSAVTRHSPLPMRCGKSVACPRTTRLHSRRSAAPWSHAASDRPSRSIFRRERSRPSFYGVIGIPIGVRGSWTGRTAEPDTSKFEYLIVTTEGDLRRAQPDFTALRRLPGGVILTARCEVPGVDIVSRYFAPFYGVDEDPVTGSAHCALATYWAPILGRNEFRPRQVSPRGGVLGVRLDAGRLHLTGRAVTIFRGELTT